MENVPILQMIQLSSVKKNTIYCPLHFIFSNEIIGEYFLF